MTNALAPAPSEQHCLCLATLHRYLPVFAHYNVIGCYHRPWREGTIWITIMPK